MKYEIGEILTPETAKEHIGKEVLVWEVEGVCVKKIWLVGYCGGFYWATHDLSGKYYMACPFTYAALPGKPKTELWVGDPIVVLGEEQTHHQISLVSFTLTWFVIGKTCRLPTRSELESAGYPEEQIENLMQRWGVED